MRLALLGEERVESSGKGRSDIRQAVYRQAIAIVGPPADDGSRRGQFEVPAGAVPSFNLQRHHLGWYVAVALGGRLRGEVRFPVTVVPVPPNPLPPGDGPSRLSDEAAALWIEGGRTVFLPGATLEGGYEVHGLDNAGPLRTAATLPHSPNLIATGTPTFEADGHSRWCTPR